MKIEDPPPRFCHNPKCPLQKNLKMTVHLCLGTSLAVKSFLIDVATFQRETFSDDFAMKVFLLRRSKSLINDFQLQLFAERAFAAALKKFWKTGIFTKKELF